MTVKVHGEIDDVQFNSLAETFRKSFCENTNIDKFQDLTIHNTCIIYPPDLVKMILFCQGIFFFNNTSKE